MRWSGYAFIIAGLLLTFIDLGWSFWGFVLFALGAVQVWYGEGSTWSKILWTVLPPAVWTVRLLYLLSRMH